MTWSAIGIIATLRPHRVFVIFYKGLTNQSLANQNSHLSQRHKSGLYCRRISCCVYRKDLWAVCFILLSSSSQLTQSIMITGTTPEPLAFSVENILGSPSRSLTTAISPPSVSSSFQPVIPRGMPSPRAAQMTSFTDLKYPVHTTIPGHTATTSLLPGGLLPNINMLSHNALAAWKLETELLSQGLYLDSLINGMWW